MKKHKRADKLQQIFNDIGERGVYADIKYLQDLVPRERVKKITAEYELLKEDPHFDVRDFVSRHFYSIGLDAHPMPDMPPSVSIDAHIEQLWDTLTIKHVRTAGSLIGLPHPYVVPGGRFSEQFYWDSYFIMLGLAQSGRWKLIDGMVKNAAYMIRSYGFVPSGNRTYFLTRSQPPFFALMLELLAQKKGRKRTFARYHYELRREYDFWMLGRKMLHNTDHKAYARLVEMPGSELVNRYYDNTRTPRPESILADKELSASTRNREADRIYLHVRAAAESGWDFSGRWFSDHKTMQTIHTADIIPVDLNCLLYVYEKRLADNYRGMGRKQLAHDFEARAESRQRAIDKYCWDEKRGFYVDFNFHRMQKTGSLTLAGVFPLFVGIASEQQAERVAHMLERDFLQKGGLVTSLAGTGQQWDYPNGWAPLQYVAVRGLERYGYQELADEIKRRWDETVKSLYAREHRLVEKYDVMSARIGGGGEYVTQDGFGWTNAIYAVFAHELGRRKR